MSDPKTIRSVLVLVAGAMGFAAITQIFLGDFIIGLAAFTILFVLVWAGRPR